MDTMIAGRRRARGERPADGVLHQFRTVPGGRPSLVPGSSRRDAGDRRRIRLRQERQRIVDHAPGAGPAGPHRRRLHAARRHRSARPERAGDAQDPRRPHVDDLPGADDLAQSGDADRRPDRGSGSPASQHEPGRDLEAGRRDAAAGPHSGAGAARAGISAPALRRHAPARDDRDGAGLPAGAADRGRADHRARRHHPGPDPGAGARSAEGARDGADPDHARSRRGRPDRAARHRDVCRQEGRRGRCRDLVCAARDIPIRAG